LVLDVSTPDEYRLGHIPGAVLINPSELMVRRNGIPNELPPLPKLEKMFRDAGVRDTDRVVITSHDPLLATRLWFTLDYLGYADRASILDGGNVKITDVTINPWWNVPDSIADNELWPKQRRNHRYFAREHMVVTNDSRIRQRPGEWNSLGRIKFEMANGFNVYLHDTPAKSLFNETVRTFSHGCIRIERPLDLAHYLLGDQPKWSDAAIETAIVGGESQTVAITTPVPVYVLYWTAWPASDGDIEYHRDVYGNDARVIAALGSE
ncbi:MAG TPA: L,D-transpeptidase family protein, partial [Thermoanaerobaculia bacterium]